MIADLSLRTPSFVLLPLALILSGVYTFWGASRRSVLLTDMLALSFSHNALSLLKLDSFKTGCILLSGLFVYDVWWVFGTDVVREFDLVDWREVLNMKDCLDGESGDDARCADQASVAEIATVRGPKRVHDAWAWGCCNSRDIHRPCASL